MDQYTADILSLTRQLKEHLEASCVPGALDLKSAMFPVSWGVLLRMDAIYRFNSEVKKLLNKRIANNAADAFTEALAWYITAAAKSNGYEDITVKSEHPLDPKAKGRGKLKPDISIWHKDRCIGVVEAKTQLGWSRSTWEGELLDRERALQSIVPDLDVVFVVLTSCNWSGFLPEHAKTGTQWFHLCDTWPGSADKMNLIHPIEDALMRIFQRSL